MKLEINEWINQKKEEIVLLMFKNVEMNSYNT